MTEGPLSVSSLEGDHGLRFRDRIEDVRFEIYTDDPVSPRSADTAPFAEPLDVAVAVETKVVRFPYRSGCYVRSPETATATQVVSGTERIEFDSCEIEPLSTPFTLYVRAGGPLTISVNAEHLQFTLDRPGPVVFGVRSDHSQPAGTVRTTSDPRDVMRAVSTFGSALKTLSPRRSYPTLRGHPPLVEQGSELSIPDTVTVPDSGVTVEVPPDLASVYRVAPLAYYLGATVRPGAEPRVLADGVSLSLSTPTVGTERRIDQFLKQTFFLDCVVRHKANEESGLHERDAVESSLTFDPAAVYDAPLPERVVAYDDVPFEAVEPHLPAWPLHSDFEPRIEHVGYLPFAAKRLSSMRVRESPDASTLAPEPSGVTEFVRSPVSGRRDPATGNTLGSDPPETDALTHAWLAPGCPTGVSTPDVSSMTAQATRSVESVGETTVDVVCTDREMATETTGDLYGLRELVDFDVTVHHDCSVNELATLLRGDSDFFHYIGHVDDDGFRCADGTLDARTLDAVGIESFLLNACRSYEQGRALVDAGAVGGIVTVATVFNEEATTVGRHVARLLNKGFPLDATLTVLDYGSVSAERYAVVGAHRQRICQPERGNTGLCLLDRDGDDYELGYVWLPSDEMELGTEGIHEPGDERHYLATGYVDTWTLPESEVEARLTSPLVFEGELHWTDELPDGA